MGNPRYTKGKSTVYLHPSVKKYIKQLAKEYKFSYSRMLEYLIKVGLKKVYIPSDMKERYYVVDKEIKGNEKKEEV